MRATRDALRILLVVAAAMSRSWDSPGPVSPGSGKGCPGTRTGSNRRVWE